ncbi:MAG: glycine cleavage system protein GcvH [Deltaproteobacteria bacterium]|nr:glycine cleavage system protein GcvH [Deltaproteobacteria bacterium]
MEIQGYDLPENLYYEENHFWVRDDGDLLVMGMDDFAQKMAGEIVFVQLPLEGKKIKIGKKFAKMESGKWLGKVFGPVNGELAAVNEELEEDPGLINEDCYGKGWIYKIKPDDKTELENLIQAPDEIEKWVLADIEKYAEEK